MDFPLPATCRCIRGISNVVRYVKAAYHSSNGKLLCREPSISGQPSQARFEFAVYKRKPSFPFFHLVRPPLFFFRPPTTQNSLLSYVDVPFSGWICHHFLLFLNCPHLLPTTRENMPAAQNHLPSIHVNVATDTRKISLVNLSYPIRPTHTPWVESTVPLVFKVCYVK